MCAATVEGVLAAFDAYAHEGMSIDASNVATQCGVPREFVLRLLLLAYDMSDEYRTGLLYLPDGVDWTPFLPRRRSLATF